MMPATTSPLLSSFHNYDFSVSLLSGSLWLDFSQPLCGRGVGKWILRLMQGFFETGSSSSEPEDLTKKGKRNKGSRRYLPQKNSVAYALLITLYRGTDNGNEFMRKQELIDAAEASGLSRVPIMHLSCLCLKPSGLGCQRKLAAIHPSQHLERGRKEISQLRTKCLYYRAGQAHSQSVDKRLKFVASPNFRIHNLTTLSCCRSLLLGLRSSGMAGHKIAHATLKGPSVVKEICYGMVLAMAAGSLWKMHHWNEQRKVRVFYDLLEKGEISVVADE